MIEKLTALWKICSTKQLAKAFEEYMKSLNIKKWRSNRKDNSNTYLIDGESTHWNRVQCYYYKDTQSFGAEDLKVVLRKEAGNYLIIAKKGNRAFEIDHRGIRHYDEILLNEIIEEHKPLFDLLFSQCHIAKQET
jgi:hypothetical protein